MPEYCEYHPRFFQEGGDCAGCYAIDRMREKALAEDAKGDSDA